MEKEQPQEIDEQETQQIVDSQLPYNQQEAPEAGIINALNPKKILDEIRLELQGYSYNPINKRYEKIEGMQPIMNDVGISKVLQIMSSYINQLTTMSNLDSILINNLVVHICSETFFNVGLNWKKFGIIDKSSISTVRLKIELSAVSALNRAKGSGDRNVIRNVINETSAPSQYYPQQVPESMISKLSPFGKKRI